MGHEPNPIDLQQVDEAVEAAGREVEAARDLRQALRWATRKGDPDRSGRIQSMLADINAAQQPIRSLIGRVAWDPIPDTHERRVRAVSQDLQYERRQLKKML